MVEVYKTYSAMEPRIAAYGEEVLSAGGDMVLAEVRQRSLDAGLPGIALPYPDARHLMVYAALCQPKLAVEIGTLGGYSGICIARHLASGGKLITIDIEPAHHAVARESFAKAGVADRVELRLGAALPLFEAIAANHSVDFIFLDADRENYPRYLELGAQCLSPGGLFLVDNAFAYGSIGKTSFVDDEEKGRVEATDAFNRMILSRDDFVSTLLPTCDGLLAAVKRPSAL